MPNYVRLREEGAIYFFTVVTHERRPIFSDPLARECFRGVWKELREKHPYNLHAICLMPDHLHCIWGLHEGDDDYELRWNFIKGNFTRRFLAGGGSEGKLNSSRRKRGERGIWQRRFWEHKIRDEADYDRHFDYVHYNPVKHGFAAWPEEWAWSTFHRYAEKGWYDAGWGHEAPKNIEGFEPYEPEE